MESKKDQHLSEEDLITLIEKDISNQHLNECALCEKRLEELKLLIATMEESKDVEVPDSVRWGVESAIALEKNIDGHAGSIRWNQIAAAVAFILIGFFGGMAYNPSDGAEVAELQKQVDLLKEVTLINALNQNTTSERIHIINQIETTNQVSNKLIEPLIQTLNSDKSANVRYEAAQAISRFIDQEKVRMLLVRSLKFQTDPLIQISLIRMLVDAEEHAAIAPMKELISRENTTPEVKRQAEIALQVLI
ncbi:MAG: HEAT repeat domain-containing protein [Cyclobacteriaceae bacterium]